MALQIKEDIRAEMVSGPFVAVVTAVERLSRVVEEETRVLRCFGDVDFERLNHQKNFGLLELTRAMRVLPASERTGQVADHLRRLRGLLDDNERILRLHFQAAEEISNLVARTIEDASSDGTYSASISRDGSR